MRLQGKDAISNSTKLTARTLLSVSAVVVFVLLHGAPVEKFSLLGLEFAGVDINNLFPALLVFLAVSHIVQWLADMISFRTWNLVGLMPDRDTSWEYSPLTTKLDMVVRKIVDANEKLSEVEVKPREPDKRLSLSEAMGFLSIAQRQLSSMRSEVIAFNWYALFFVYVWYLALPLGVSFFAIYLSIKTLLQ